MTMFDSQRYSEKLYEIKYELFINEYSFEILDINFIFSIVPL